MSLPYSHLACTDWTVAALALGRHEPPLLRTYRRKPWCCEKNWKKDWNWVQSDVFLLNHVKDKTLSCQERVWKCFSLKKLHFEWLVMSLNCSLRHFLFTSDLLSFFPKLMFFFFLQTSFPPLETCGMRYDTDMFTNQIVKQGETITYSESESCVWVYYSKSHSRVVYESRLSDNKCGWIPTKVRFAM